jgi:hypothetical protein
MNVRVDSTDHTCLAVLSLGAVEPHGLCVFDVDGGHEAGEEGVGLVGHYVLDRDAGLIESGLHD